MGKRWFPLLQSLCQFENLQSWVGSARHRKTQLPLQIPHLTALLQTYSAQELSHSSGLIVMVLSTNHPQGPASTGLPQ